MRTVAKHPGVPCVAKANPNEAGLTTRKTRSTRCHGARPLSMRCVISGSLDGGSHGIKSDARLARTLERGEPCPVRNKSGTGDGHGDDAGDVFRCVGCTKPECQSPTGCQCCEWRLEPGGYLKQCLVARVYDVASETELHVAKGLSRMAKNTVLLKREDTQPVFSFKLRGAFNKMSQLSREELARGVICSSAGNHAQGVALSAQVLGCKAVICMPLITPEIKIEAVRRLGGEVKLVGENYDACQAFAIEKANKDGLTYIHPFDDPFVIAGQGTVGVEILRQCSPSHAYLSEDVSVDGNDNDNSSSNIPYAIFVPVGGGGLLSGVLAFVKQVRPDIKVFGVEPVGAACVTEALMRGGLCTLDAVDAFADGVAVKTSGKETLRLIEKFCDGIITVTTEEICAAIKDVFKDTRSILEPAGAVSVAGLKSYCKRTGIRNSVLVAITSGANLNFDRLRVVSDIANFGAKTEVMLAASIPEVPGAFKRFVDVLLESDATTAGNAGAVGGKNDSGGICLTEFKYRYAFNAEGEAHVLFSVEVDEESEQKAQLVERLARAGMSPKDLSHLETAQLHLRHLVGGRARSFTGTMPDERIMQVAFPERPGALKDFLSALKPDWNITLFHYRQTGNLETALLIGIQVPQGQYDIFQETMARIGYRNEEIGEDAYEAFSMFIY